MKWIRSGWLTMGPRTFEFEKEFAKYVGAPVVSQYTTGTAALHLALEAAGVRAGDEVLLYLQRRLPLLQRLSPIKGPAP